MASHVVAHLVWQDVKHNLRPIRALPLLLLTLLFAYGEVYDHMEESMTHVQGALSLHASWLLFSVPVLAGAMGGTLAAERRAGITLTLLTKGVHRSEYVRARLLGAAASTAAMTIVSILGFYVIVSAIWPMDRVTWEGKTWPGPLYDLYSQNPLAHDMLRAPMFVVAAAALALVGVLAGVLVANEYVAMVATPTSLIIVTVIMRQVSHLLNPQRYLDLGYDFYWGPHFRWLIPFAPFLYWGTFALVISILCQRIFAKKEIA